MGDEEDNYIEQKSDVNRLYNEYLKDRICKTLDDLGYVKSEKICQRYFFEAGLAEEIFHQRLTNTESLAKIISFAMEKETVIKKFQMI